MNFHAADFINKLKGRGLTQAFKAFVLNKRYPCLAARAAFNHDSVKVIVATDLALAVDDEKILNEIYAFINRWRENPHQLSSFVVIFEGPKNMSEIDFENLLWKRLQCLHLKDSEKHPWAEKLSADVTSADFGLSLGGEGFFVIGMHPNSSRKARQFRSPVLVFNLHAQFEQLRASHAFEPMRDQTRKRDMNFSGSVNPMVEDFGVSSEALQYSGRLVDKAHRCPFATFFKKLKTA